MPLLSVENATKTFQMGEVEVLALRREEFNLAAANALNTAINLGPTYVAQWLSRKGLQKEELNQRLEQARARLVRAEHQVPTARVEAPADGVVLEIRSGLKESDEVVTAPDATME